MESVKLVAAANVFGFVGLPAPSFAIERDCCTPRGARAAQSNATVAAIPAPARIRNRPALLAGAAGCDSRGAAINRACTSIQPVCVAGTGDCRSVFNSCPICVTVCNCAWQLEQWAKCAFTRALCSEDNRPPAYSHNNGSIALQFRFHIFVQHTFHLSKACTRSRRERRARKTRSFALTAEHPKISPIS